MREALRQGYGLRDLRADVLAGCVVGVVALPLSMALAIATGVAPQYGLYTAIVAGGLSALLGGSRVQVTGPTAAFVVILAPITAQFGLQGLALATVMAGLILIALGIGRLGRLVEFVPYPVTTGFTAGIGLVIATFQVKDFLGLTVETVSAEAHYVERVGALARALPTIQWWDLGIGVLTLAILSGWRMVKSKVPSPLVALLVAAVLAWVLERFVEGFEVATLRSRFGSSDHPSGIPQLPPLFVLPWNLPDAAGIPGGALSFTMIRALLPSAFAIAMLGAIESLLSAVVSDGMSGHKHDPDVELFAQGAGNVVAPFFGGFSATGAIARTATNVRSGARSPIAAVVHAGFVLVALLTLAPALGWLPMASLAALLLMVAWNMAELRHFKRMLRIAPKSDSAVLLTCFALTVLFDMTVSVTAGILLAAMLFMRRMIEISGAKLIGERHPELGESIPKGVLVYDIGGPLFFGAAHKAMSEIFSADRKDVKVVVLDLEDVPVMDATGLVNLQSAIDRLKSAHIRVLLAELQAQPTELLMRAGVIGEGSGVETHGTLVAALESARAVVGGAG